MQQGCIFELVWRKVWVTAVPLRAEAWRSLREIICETDQTSVCLPLTRPYRQASSIQTIHQTHMPSKTHSHTYPCWGGSCIILKINDESGLSHATLWADTGGCQSHLHSMHASGIVSNQDCFLESVDGVITAKQVLAVWNCNQGWSSVNSCRIVSS